MSTSPKNMKKTMIKHKNHCECVGYHIEFADYLIKRMKHMESLLPENIRQELDFLKL